MDRLLIYLARFAVIIAGYALAALTASAAMHILMLPQVGLQQEMTAPAVVAIMTWSIPFIALFIAYFAFVPSMVAIGIGEMFSARGWLYHALAGGAVGVALAVLFQTTAPDDFLSAGSELEIIPPGRSIHDPTFLATLAGAGMFGGLAYWLVAGRTAGNWRSAAKRPLSPAP